jgi:N-acyl-D-amino-acid deacylase
MLAGAWHLRLKVGASDKNQPATPEQVEALTGLAETAMQQGAFGVSFGLAYAPGTSTEELQALFAAAARHDGIAAVHQRYAGFEVPGYTRDAIAGEIELIEAARKTGCRLQISHIGHMIGYASQPYDRFFLRCLEIVEQARAEGLDITADSFIFGGAGSIISDSMTEMLFSPQFKRIMGMEVEEYATISLGPYEGKPLTRELYTLLLEEAPNTPVFIDRLVMEDLVLRSILPSWVIMGDGVQRQRAGMDPAHPADCAGTHGARAGHAQPDGGAREDDHPARPAAGFEEQGAYHGRRGC